VDVLDAALVGFGFPVGPITLMDEVGLDVGGKVGKTMFESFGARMAPADGVKRVVESGRLGRKGRKGFYLYDSDGRKGDVDPSVYPIILGADRATDKTAVEPMPGSEIVDRCVLAMVNEAVLCLEEGILRSPRDGDIGAVFGLGFPPFRGGPFRFVDALGVDEVLGRLDTFDGRFPERFKPAPMLIEMSRARTRFYPADGRPV
jgi:3-hydroxyacyl-CoA dehydrogenase/enoyl-CoA hydratase/3-hydroxybutyryl-CoA epimerase